MTSKNIFISSAIVLTIIILGANLVRAQEAAQPPIISTQFSPTTVMAGKEYVFGTLVTDDNLVSCSVDVGEGDTVLTTYGAENPTYQLYRYTYLTPGKYQVFFTCMDETKLSKEERFVVTVDPVIPDEISVNYTSPRDGDGISVNGNIQISFNTAVTTLDTGSLNGSNFKVLAKGGDYVAGELSTAVNPCDARIIYSDRPSSNYIICNDYYTFTPTEPLIANTTYHVTIFSGRKRGPTAADGAVFMANDYNFSFTATGGDEVIGEEEVIGGGISGIIFGGANFSTEDLQSFLNQIEQ